MLTRVASRCIGAPEEHGRDLCHRVLSVACSGFLTVADIECDIGATRDGKSSAGPALRPANLNGGRLFQRRGPFARRTLGNLGFSNVGWNEIMTTLAAPSIPRRGGKAARH